MTVRRSQLGMFFAVAILSFVCTGTSQAAFIAADIGVVAGTQDHTGSLGLRFTVNSPISITSMGVFDDNADGILSTLRSEIYNYTTQALIAGTQTSFPTASPGTIQGAGGMRFKAITPVTLSPGDYMLSAVGFGHGDRNGNVGGANNANTLDTGAGLITFAGVAQYSDAGTAVFPPNPDASNNQYRAGSFIFQAVPEPSTIVLFGLGTIGLFTVARRRTLR